MKYIRFGILVGMACGLLLSSVNAQQDKKTGKKEYTFRGKVQKIDLDAKTLVVNGQKVEGWMEAMTMTFAPDKADVLKNLKVGDEIVAKVYEGDFHTLHDLHAVPANGDTKGTPAKK
jgi:Cu/Ag efflux protein CusF